MVKRIFCLVTFVVALSTLLLGGTASAQSFNREKKALSDYLVRMYNNSPFEGVRVVTDYDNSYLLVVLSLDPAKYNSPSALNRVASVKAMNEASRYFNGSNISSDIIIHTSEDSHREVDTEIIEHIKEHSVGYVKSLEQLTNLDLEDGRKVFLFLKKIDLK